MFLAPTAKHNKTNTLSNIAIPAISIFESNSLFSNQTMQPKIQKVNSSVERYACEKCNKSYKNKRHWHRHVKEECIDVTPKFQCIFCYGMFRRKYHLGRHLQNKHGVMTQET